MIRAALGECGSGKTFGLQRLTAEHVRANAPVCFLVVDVNNEWPGPAFRGAPAVQVTPVHTPGQAAASLERGDRCVIVRPTLDVTDDSPAPLAAFVGQLGDVAISARQSTVLVVPEAHLSAPEHYKPPKSLHSIAHRWRHVRAGLWLDTQHPQDVNKHLLRAATRTYCFPTRAVTDLKTYERWGGARMRSQVEEATRRMQAGRPGYFVRRDDAPHFKLRRL